MDIAQSFIRLSGNPLAAYEHWIALRDGQPRLMLVDFELVEYWNSGKPTRNLTAVYRDSGSAVAVGVSEMLPAESFGQVSFGHTDQCAMEHGFVFFEVGSAIALSPISIAKPWGREVWYTGVEERGICSFHANGVNSPIPWLQAVMPGAILGKPGAALVLLKILDPSPEPVTGDLYFELHEEKREVYVITHIDELAWPGGTGYIRMGFDEQKLSAYSDDASFRIAYLRAVEAYESVRRQIDSLDPGSDPTDWLISSERQLRDEMDSFSCLQPLAVGDVVKVPLLVPHSLQHGVRAVEFQTPVYERMIISFAQKVLTQEHWDTDRAVARMRLRIEQADPLKCLQESPGVRVEEVVHFSDFEVSRVSLDGAAELQIGPLGRYVLLMVISGRLDVGAGPVEAEQSVILPIGWEGGLMSSQAASPLVFLLASPCG